MIKKIKTSFYVESIGNAFERNFSKEFIFEGESHNFIEIVYVESGKVEVVEDENIYLLEAGDIIFHAPMEFHAIKSADNTSPRVFNLSAVIRGELPENLYKGVFSLDVEGNSTFMGIFNTVKKFVDNNDVLCGQEAAHNLSLFILSVCKENRINDNLSSDPSALAFKKVVKTMNKELHSNLSLEAIASLNYISVSYLKLLFYRYANISPKKYYSAIRAREASVLVMKGMSKADVAKIMGFSSPNYFTMFFKKHMGMTPSEYQKKKLTEKK